MDHRQDHRTLRPERRRSEPATTGRRRRPWWPSSKLSRTPRACSRRIYRRCTPVSTRMRWTRCSSGDPRAYRGGRPDRVLVRGPGGGRRERRKCRRDTPAGGGLSGYRCTSSTAKSRRVDRRRPLRLVRGSEDVGMQIESCVDERKPDGRTRRSSMSSYSTCAPTRAFGR